MEFLECATTRRSVRRFTDAPVPAALVKELVATASFAPSWKNTQIARYTMLTNRDLMDKIAGEMLLGFEFNAKTIRSAPALMVVSYETGLSGYEADGSFSTPKGEGFECFDAGIASQTFCLAAHDKGLGTVILGYYDEAKIAAAIALPTSEKIAVLIAIGYPKFTPDTPERKAADTLLRTIE